MNHILYMAWRYLRYNRLKTVVLVASISLIVFLPVGLHVMVRQGAETLTARAESTPILIGAKGSATDLTLSALYFREPVLDPLPFREVQQVTETGLAVGIPLHVRFSAGAHRIVGTTPDYADFRGLRCMEGRLFAILGECVLGSRASRSLGVAVDEYVMSSPAGAFDVAGTFPLKMKVVGSFEPTGTPDDDAVFVDIKTAWVIAGLAHGHIDVTKPEAESGVLKREEDNVVANASVLSYTEITQENIDSFHFHGDPGEFPVDAILAVPPDRKSGILLRGRYEERIDPVQVLVPLAVINDLLATILSVRDYVLTASIGIGISTVATAVLVFILSIRLRRREIETIRKIGGSGRRLRAILAAEILLVFLVSILIAGGLTVVVSQLGPTVVRMMTG